MGRESEQDEGGPVKENQTVANFYEVLDISVGDWRPLHWNLIGRSFSLLNPVVKSIDFTA